MCRHWLEGWGGGGDALAGEACGVCSVSLPWLRGQLPGGLWCNQPCLVVGGAVWACRQVRQAGGERAGGRWEAGQGRCEWVGGRLDGRAGGGTVHVSNLIFLQCR